MKYDSTTNIIVLGESNTGKTTLIYNYLYKNLNTKDNITTIGIDYYKKVIYNNDKSYLLNIYDTGNGLLYRNILDCYLRKSQIFIIILKNNSFRFVKEVFEVINSDNKINPSDIFIIFNKNTDNFELNYNQKDIIKHNPKDSNIHFSCINLLDKTKVQNFFNNLTEQIFNNNTIKRIKIIKRTSLIPLNIKDNTIPEKKKYKINKSCCGNCCNIC